MSRQVFLLLKYFAAFIFFLNYCTANDTNELKIRTLPVYAMLANVNLLNSTQCSKELIQLQDAIDQQLLWGLKVIDASGKPKSAFISGNNYWLGSRSQCEDAKNGDLRLLSEAMSRNNSNNYHIKDEFPPFEVQFFVASFHHNSTLPYKFVLPEEDLILLGMCLPASCSKDQLSFLLEIVFRNRTLFEGELFSADFKLVEVRDLIDDHRWLLSGTFITMTIVVVLTLLLVIIGTCYDILIYQKKLKKYDICLQEVGNVNPPAIEEIETLNDYNKDKLEKLKNDSLYCKIFLAFSAYSNTKIIFSTKSEDVGIPVIHGLRFLTMTWIIILHNCLYSKDYFDNKKEYMRKLEGFLEQLLINGSLSVDTFLCFGGFLVAYLHLKRNMRNSIRKPHNYFNIIKLYFFTLLKRFIRLTPSYIIIIGLVQINSMWYSKTSMLHMTERSHENCQKYWWRNILYIQNLFNPQDMCMTWSWYLAIDMQYFVIINFLLFLSSIYFKVAASLLGLLFSSSIILTGYLAYVNDYIPTWDKTAALMTELYYSPFTRIGPYLVGVIAAYIVLKLKNELPLKKRTIILCWILVSFCHLSAIFGLREKRISVPTAAFYTAFGRTVWGSGIAWIIIACCTDNGGIVNRILSWKVWIPLSRLTYAAYLINPIIISSVNFIRETSTHFDFLTLVILGLGYVVVTYICSFVVSLMFETPYAILLKERINNLNRKA